MKSRATTLGVLLVMGALAGACEEEPIQVGRGVGAQAAPNPGAAPVGEQDEADGGVDASNGPREYRDDDFVEADTNRDPFRDYASMFQAGPVQEQTTRDVKMADTAVDEMRLIAVISGVADPRAMIVDRIGVGHVVRRGNFLGRPEVVQAGGLEELAVTLHWRVDRIRPNAVVLTREDPTAPNRPPLTRVLPLREDDEDLSVQVSPR